MTRYFITIVLILFSPSFSKATHLIGGEIYYDNLGGNNYRVTVKVYRDCSPGVTTPYDDPLPLTIYNANGTLFGVFNIPFPGSINVPVIINNPCLQAPPNICVEEAIYQTVVNLPPAPGGYDLVYQRCCRNNSITNLLNPGDLGTTYITHVPDPGIVSVNNSARFNLFPPIAICTGNEFTFDHSASDPDGDSLVYEFVNPYQGGSTMNPAPNPADPPPYAYVPYNSGYNPSYPLDAAPPFTIDPITGFMEGIPTTVGQYVVGVAIKEYRNGILINTQLRDFQFNVVLCDANVVSSIPVQDEFCNGLTLNLGNNSINSVYYHWNFGDPATLADTSALATPSYTYSDTGSYQIMLIANPGFSCADTAYTTYSIHPPLNISIDPNLPQCVSNNNFDFSAQGQFTPSANMQWTFTGSVSPTSTLFHPDNIVYPDSGHYPVKLIVNQFNCADTAYDTVHVFPVPVIGFDYPAQIGCLPYGVQFIDTTLSWDPVFYFWTFGDGGNSTEQNPFHVYNQVGTYDVSLTIETDSVCATTQTIAIPDLITVNPSPVASFWATPEKNSIFTPYITFHDSSFDSDLHYLFFDDGDSTTLRNITHLYHDTGHYNVMQVVINEYNCPDTAWVMVEITPETTIYVPNGFTPNGDGINDIFIPVVRDVFCYRFEIFDRWGNLFFISTTPGEGWNGVRDGKLCPLDTYVYQVHYCTQNQIEYLKRGHFSLVR